MDTETRSSTERQQNESVPEYLTRLKEMGFLFHGSNNAQIEELEPRYTLDKHSEENTDTAVFATSNVSWTIIHGVYGGHKGWSTRVKNGEVAAKIPAKDKDLVENTIGTVYVLAKDTFEKSGNGEQYKSYKAVKPIQKVTVTLNDYYDLGGKIEWF